jgi:drug/metabolite transporter (DMT)-like permease
MKLSKGFIFASLASLSWAISIIITRFVLNRGENAYNILFWMIILATPFWLVIFLKNFSEVKRMPSKNYLILLGMALVSTIGVSVVEVFALKYSPALNYSFLIRTVILFTIFFAYIFLKEKLSAKKIILASAILIGAYFLTTKGQLISFTLGDIFTLIEAILIALGNNILGKIATSRMSVNLSASASFLMGILPIVGIAYANNVIAIPKSFMLLMFLTVVNIFLSMLRFRAYKNATASYVTMIFSFTPVFVSFMAVPFLKESLNLIQILGGALIILAGIGVEKLKI